MVARCTGLCCDPCRVDAVPMMHTYMQSKRIQDNRNAKQTTPTTINQTGSRQQNFSVRNVELLIYHVRVQLLAPHADCVSEKITGVKCVETETKVYEK